MATTLPNTGAIIPAMTEPADQAVNNAAFTAIDAAIGGIIESGSNANGSYIKFADGTMQCWGTRTITADITTPFAGGFRAATATAVVFPVAFVSNTAYQFFACSASTTGAFGIVVNQGGKLAASREVFPVNVASGTGVYVYFEWMAVGRWK
jgi:hypothetical protein